MKFAVGFRVDGVFPDKEMTTLFWVPLDQKSNPQCAPLGLQQFVADGFVVTFWKPGTASVVIDTPFSFPPTPKAFPLPAETCRHDSGQHHAQTDAEWKTQRDADGTEMCAQQDCGRIIRFF